MNIVEATASYERWAASHLTLIKPDLAYKHSRMEKALFSFMRATFYRWVQLSREACPDLLDAPSLLAVGDLHVENFGTWRDAEGRLVWGINDFDEVARMPYTLDLVRLAASAFLAIREGGLRIDPGRACAAILSGYAGVLKNGPRGFVLEEDHADLRAMALGADRDPKRFWKKMLKLKSCGPVPKEVRRLLADALPAPRLTFKIVHRRAGLGSLGRPRYTAVAVWRDAMIAHEAKALLPSAYGWAIGRPATASLYGKLLDQAIRTSDPFLTARGSWVVRRLAPHCSRIELSHLPRRRNERELLEAMGAETANLHSGTPEAIAAVRRDLRSRGTEWLGSAARTMVVATESDWNRWRRR